MIEKHGIDYDGTKPDFENWSSAMISAIPAGAHIKERLFGVANQITALDWRVARAARLDRLFLAHLIDPNEYYLYTADSVDRFLPAALDISTKEQLKRRDERVRHAIEALEEGWPQDDAIVFVCSKEEWASVLRGVGRQAQVA